MWVTQLTSKPLDFVSWEHLYIVLMLMNNIRGENFPLEWFSSSVLSNISSLFLLSLCANNCKWDFFLYRFRLECHVNQKFHCDVVHSKMLHCIKATLNQNNFHYCFQLLPFVIWFRLLAFLKHVFGVRNFKECCL